MKTREEIIAEGDFGKYGIEPEHLEVSGPVDPFGWTVRWGLVQWADRLKAYRNGESVFGADIEPTNPYREKADEYLGNAATPIAARRHLFEPGAQPKNIEGETETVRLANGKTIEVVRNGVGLQKTDPDDPALQPQGSWNLILVD